MNVRDFHFQNLVSVEFAVRTILEEPVSRFIMTEKKLDCDWQRTGQLIVNFLICTAIQINAARLQFSQSYNK